MLLKELREQVLAAGLQMLEDGVAHGAQGNISAMDAESGYIAITPSAIPYTALKPEDICIVDKSRRMIEGKWKPTSEIALHMIFYNNRPDVQAVVHSHAPYCSVFGIINEPLPSVLSESAQCLGGGGWPVPVAPYGRPGGDEVARLTFEAMGENVAAIMAHHGLVSVGANLAQAYEATIAAENTARLVILARSMGAREVLLDPSEGTIMRENYLKKYKPTVAGS